MKAIETEYKGIKFRSKLEAQWAVFFDECNVDWEYEPQGFDLGDGVWYLPDFVLHNVGNCEGADENGDLWIEVKGRMTPQDAKKINYWTKKKGILVLGRLPFVNKNNEIDIFSFIDIANSSGGEYWWMFYNFSTLISNQWGAAPGLDENGRFMLIEYEHGGDGEDWDLTSEAYYTARNYRFDHKK